jgi:DNA polymerase epsilon subunit 3
VKLQKDTVLSLVKGATVFINYLGACMFFRLPLYIHVGLLFLIEVLCSCHVCSHYYAQTLRVGFDASNARAHEVSTSKQHKSISASDVFKALELIEFTDLIPPLQAELQGTLIRFTEAMFRKPHSNPIRVSVYRELAKNKKVSTAGGASSSAPPARNKGSATAVQRGKGKERVTEGDESSASAPLPNALGALSLEPQPQVQLDDAHGYGPNTDPETYAMVEQDGGEGEGEGEGDDEDRTELELPELEPELEVEGEEADDADDMDEDVDMDADTREVQDLMEDEDDVE